MTLPELDGTPQRHEAWLDNPNAGVRPADRRGVKLEATHRRWAADCLSVAALTVPLRLGDPTGAGLIGAD